MCSQDTHPLKTTPRPNSAHRITAIEKNHSGFQRNSITEESQANTAPGVSSATTYEGTQPPHHERKALYIIRKRVERQHIECPGGAICDPFSPNGRHRRSISIYIVFTQRKPTKNRIKKPTDRDSNETVLLCFFSCPHGHGKGVELRGSRSIGYTLMGVSQSRGMFKINTSKKLKNIVKSEMEHEMTKQILFIRIYPSCGKSTKHTSAVLFKTKTLKRWLWQK